LSVLNRTHSLAELSSRVFDLLVIGGGITGAGIARDASLRGLSVALIDKSDFGSGTSSRSSRLIHGGVRYLEHGHLHLVFEASAERRRLRKIAPHLVQPLAFSWPVYRGQRMAMWKLRAGLTLYDALSLFRNFRRHRSLNAERALRAEPNLRKHDLRGAVRYYDAATDDARLTLANVVDAMALGAVAANHVALTGAAPTRDGARVTRAQDALTGERIEIRSRVLVNATGPWSDAVESVVGDTKSDAVQGSKGTHIAVERNRIGNRDAIVMIHPRDGRVMFALPAGEHAILGTTDTFTSVSPDEVRANEADVAYLLEAANVYFPDARLRRDDVVSAWAGIRPLMPTSGSSVSASREHLIQAGDGSVRITGGKLTTYRVMAMQAVNAAATLLGKRLPKTRTGERPLPAVDRELVCTLGDLLIRRTKVAFETRDNGRTAAREAVYGLAAAHGWDASRRERELARYDTEVTRIFGVDP
jgi:glycerol-3-phosphate dehydrogenase